ncbi:MAG: arylsulfatase [Pirellulaceae bacterium]
MNRSSIGNRPFIRFPLLLALLLLLPAGAATAAERPNIVVILADDMGLSDIGCYGSEIETPHLDRLAAGGVRFTQFYNTARCCPTRASLLTGLYPHQAGMGHMIVTQEKGSYQGDLNRRCVTFAEVLRPAGYSTYAVGKWHVAKATTPAGPKYNWPLQRGFDRFYGMITGAGNFYDPATLTRDNKMISPRTDAEYQPEQYYFTDAITDHAVRFIGDHQQTSPDKPLAMYVAYTAAHWPMQALAGDIAKYKGKYDAGYEAIRRARFERMKQLGIVAADHPWTETVGDWNAVEDKAWEARCMEVYAAMIDRMDQGIGRIVAQLKATGRLDNTLILFLQDNGACAETIGRARSPRTVDRPAKPPLEPRTADAIELAVIPRQTRDGYVVRQGPGVMPGADDTYIAYGEAWANVSNTPLREYKHWVHEGGISTPLIAHWPQGIARRGELEHQPGHLIDVMATCVELAGATYPKQARGEAILPLEGISLVPAFAGEPLAREAIYWEHEGNRAIRVGKWKLVAKGPAGAWELYDIATDRTELTDLAAKQPERASQMQSLWEAWARRTSVLPWIWKPQYGEMP